MVRAYYKIIFLIIAFLFITLGDIGYASSHQQVLKVVEDENTSIIINGETDENISVLIKDEIYFVQVKGSNERDQFWFYCFKINENDKKHESSLGYGEINNYSGPVEIRDNEVQKCKQGDIIKYEYNGIEYETVLKESCSLVKYSNIAETDEHEIYKKLIILVAEKNSSEGKIVLHSVDAIYIPNLDYKEYETLITDAYQKDNNANSLDNTDFIDTEKIDTESPNYILIVKLLIIFLVFLILATLVVVSLFIFRNLKGINSSAKELVRFGHNNQAINQSIKQSVFKINEELENFKSKNSHENISIIKKIIDLKDRVGEIGKSMYEQREFNNNLQEKEIITKTIDIALLDKGEFVNGEIREGENDFSIFNLTYYYEKDNPETILNYEVTVKSGCEKIFGGKFLSKKVNILFDINSEYDNVSDYTMSINRQPVLLIEKDGGIWITEKGELLLEGV